MRQGYHQKERYGYEQTHLGFDLEVEEHHQDSYRRHSPDIEQILSADDGVVLRILKLVRDDGEQEHGEQEAAELEQTVCDCVLLKRRCQRYQYHERD